MLIELDDVIHEAVRHGMTVELTKADRYGYQILIDGEPLLGSGDGIAHESFSWPLEDVRIDERSEDLVEKMVRSKKRRMNRSRMERLQTENQCASEGEELPIHE